MHDSYLDNAATSFPKPESVYAAMDGFIRKIGASPARGSYPRAQESERCLVRGRSKLAQLLGIANPSRLIFTANATDAINIALKGFLQTGDHVITTSAEHNAVLRPLWAMQTSRGITLSIVPTNALGEIDPDALFQQVTPKTRLVCCTHASNVLGTLQPVEEIARRCRALGIACLVDGSQSAGVIPVDMEKLGVDFFAFTGHKSLLGPTGTGGLYVRDGIDIATFREGGSGSHSEDLNQPTVWPERHESGTPNMMGLVGLFAGVDFLLEKGVSTIQQHERELTHQLMEGFRRIPGITLYGPDVDKKVGITSIGFSAMSTAEMGQILGKKFGIMIRTGIHCAPLIHQQIGTAGQGTLRFSVGYATTQDDITAAIQSVQDIASAVYRRQPAASL